jgi:hypothetical protein
MKLNFKRLFPILFFAEGIGALIWYFCIPSENGILPWLPLSKARLLIALIAIAFLVGTFILWVKHDALTHFKEVPAFLFTHPAFRIILFLLAIFFIEMYLLTYILLPPFLRPFLAWFTLVSMQAWIVLRANLEIKPPSLSTRLKINWREKSPAQRRTALVLAGIGLIYFCAFIPVNSLGWNDPNRNFMSGIDEGIQYPIVVQTLTPGATIESTIYRLLINESDVYGHPYVAYEALILLPSRLIFGVNFGDQLALNLTLLRMFVNVLPILLSMYLLVYMVTRFRKTLPAVGLFLLLLTIPGVIAFNTRFLHPDAVILFLVILTIYYLQRDRLRFGRNFYFAAVACSLAAVIKLWGFFFFAAIFVYLVVGVAYRHITVKNAFRSGLIFLLVMLVTALLSNPGLLVPAVFKELVHGLTGQVQNRVSGYSSDAIYTKSFSTWMGVFNQYYLTAVYFYICAASLVLSSIKGRRRLYALITLLWCAVLLVFFSKFLAAKSFWYALEVMIPLYPAPFLLLHLADKEDESRLGSFLCLPVVQTAAGIFVAVCCGGQFILNILQIVSLF